MKAIIGVLIGGVIMSGSAFAACSYEEGDDYTAKGKYNWADTCDVHATVEKVNKKCTKAKINVDNITGAWGFKMNVACRFEGTEAGAGDVVWVPIK